MQPAIDMVIERSQLMRSRGRWRVAAILLFVVIVVVLSSYGSTAVFDKKDSPHIARISINDFIFEDRRQLTLIRDIQENDNVKAVVLTINSPGGSVSGGEALYEAIRALSEKKPVAVHIGTLAASAGYMIALAGDHIVARQTALTGSIGVIFMFGEASRLLDTIGVSMTILKSSPLKGEPTPFAPLNDQTREVLTELVDETYLWFVGLVADRRKMTLSDAKKLSDGRVYTGLQAKKMSLIDEIGGENIAIDWLKSQSDISSELEVKQWRIKQPEKFSWLDFVSNVSGVKIGGELFKAVKGDLLQLDGLLSIWHVSLLSKSKEAY